MASKTIKTLFAFLLIAASLTVWVEDFKQVNDSFFSTPTIYAQTGGNRYTVLTYNTHLFEGSVADDFGCLVAGCDITYDDGNRRDLIAEWVEQLGADLVAFQEVWNPANQEWFIDRLKDTYPYSSFVKGTCSLMNGSGLVLLSKLPFADGSLSFTRFPSFDVELSGDYMAGKGVITATILVGTPPRPIRIGISHALTNGKSASSKSTEDRKSKWAPEYVPTAFTPFQLNGKTYMFNLKKNFNEGYITQFEDYSYYDEDEQEYKHGAGWKDVYVGYWDSDYVAVESFELNGHPWLFGLKSWPNKEAWFTRIKNDPSEGWEDFGPYYWDYNYNGTTITSFEINNKPYIFGLKTTYDQAWISRINADPITGNVDPFNPFTDFGPIRWDRDYVAIQSFELNGQPWLFGLKSGYNQAYLTRINIDPITGDLNAANAITDFGPYYWDRHYNGSTITTFELNGKPYIFGLKTTWDQAWMTRINTDPVTGEFDTTTPFTDFGPFQWDSDYIAIESFELNGHPHLLSLKDCCSYSCINLCGERCPGEAYITRINDDGEGFVDVTQFVDIRIIRDATAQKDLFAIVMGDFNVHKSKYGFMDKIFQNEGFVDAYIRVHGTAEGGETIDRDNNLLDQQFYVQDKGELPPPCNGNEKCFDRLDYVYVKEGSSGYGLVPKEAYVIQDWVYPSGLGTETALSDHYPLVVVLGPTDTSTTTSTTTTTTVEPTTTTTAEPTTTTTKKQGLCPFKQIYGEYSEQIELLRYIRDDILNQTPEGQEIIRLYYQWSPVIVNVMEENEEFKDEVRELIDEVLELISETK